MSPHPSTAATPPATGDADLAAGVLRRDEAAVSALLALLRRGLARALAGRGAVNDADLDDFAQEAALRVVERAGEFRGDSRFSTWAIAVAVRVALTHLRTRRWQRERPTAVVYDAVGPAGAAPEPASGRDGERDPAHHADRGELLEALRRAVEADLTDRQRSAVLKFLSGAPQAALAAEMGVTSGAFHKMMHDARLRLRTALERAGFDSAGVLATLDAAPAVAGRDGPAAGRANDR